MLPSSLQSCEICQEPFETYWVEEEEDWFLKNAVKVDDKVCRGSAHPLLISKMSNKNKASDQLFVFPPQNFHPSCFEDYKNVSHTSSLTSSLTSFSLISSFLLFLLLWYKLTCFSLRRSHLSPQTSSYVDVTPSPSKLLTDHPLGAFVKTEEKQEEVTSCAVAAAAAAAATSVKQEVQNESGEPPEVKTEAGEAAAAL